jgi:galactose oxidase
MSEAGNRGTWSAAAEVDILTPGPSAGVGGRWDAPISFPLVPVSAVLLPNNKLLTFSAYSPTQADRVTPATRVAILDLTSGTVSQAATVNTGHQMFCTGLALLADGRVLIDGGSSDRRTTIYNPMTNTWTAGPLLNIARGYQGDTLLPTGQVLTIGGSWNDSAGGKGAEIFTPGGTTGSWARLPNVSATNILTADPAGVFRSDNHPWLFAISNGGVFHAGPSRQMNWITTAGNGSITSAGPRSDSPDAMNGNAVMYDVGRILTIGGATVYQDHPPVVNSQATRRAYALDIRGGPTIPVVTTRVSDMAYARSFGNSVVLPDGKVLVVGGQQHPQAYTDTGAAMSPELWDPTTGQFTTMATEAMPRTYHSVAVLLPDARVFSGGGGLCGGCTTNHLDARIFTPPYLLNADGTPRTRPTIITAPAAAAHGSTITVSTDSPTPEFALVRASAVTHSVNNDQRRIPLVPATTNGTTYTLEIPADRGVALPGPYLLFAINASGTPSVAKFITIN